MENLSREHFLIQNIKKEMDRGLPRLEEAGFKHDMSPNQFNSLYLNFVGTHVLPTSFQTQFHNCESDSGEDQS